MLQRGKRRSASPQQRVATMLRQAAFSDSELLNANEKLSELYREFADAADVADRRLYILAHRISSLQKIVQRLRILLQQTNKPFEGRDVFQKTLSGCDLFITFFSIPSRHGRLWSCSEEHINALDAELMTGTSLLATSILVLLGETFFGNDDREPGASAQTTQSTRTEHGQPANDPHIEQFEQFWAKIIRLVYRRKRKILLDSSPTGSATEFEVEVRDTLRQLMLKNAKLIPGAASGSTPQFLQSAQTIQPLELEALSNEKLLEINRQQERFGRTASGRRRPLLSAAELKRRDSFVPTIPGRVYTLPSDYPSEAPPQGSTTPTLHDGMIFIDNNPPYKLTSIECKLIEKKRKVICLTVHSPPMMIIHELPPSSKRYPRTTHPKMEEGGSPHVDFYEDLHVKINADYPRMASIKYKFSQVENIKIFQGMIRDKELIEMFCVDEIESALYRIEASNQHLKVWKDRKTGDYTFSLFRNGVVKQHLECALSSFEIMPAKQPKKKQIVRLDFVDEAATHRRASSHDSSSSLSLNQMRKRNSVTSFDTTKSSDKLAILAKQRDQMKKAADSVEFLSIEFSGLKHANEFRTLFRKAQEDPVKSALSSLGSEGSSPPNPEGGWRDFRRSSSSRPKDPVDLQLTQIGSQFHSLGLDSTRLDILPPSRPLVDPFFDALIMQSPAVSPILEHRAVIRAENIRRSHLDYTVGWICALAIEFSAAMVMLDETHPALPQHFVDKNAYELGRIGEHNVVITCLPKGMTGTISANTVAAHLSFSFPNITTRLMVGIAGGVPSEINDIRLGDVVVSKPGPLNSGVVQYDFGKRMGDRFVQTGQLPSPPASLLAVVSLLEARNDTQGSQITTILQAFDTELRQEKFRYPGANHDQLFQSDYEHITGGPTCAKCDRSRVRIRPKRRAATFVHHGAIASGNTLMRGTGMRDELGQRHGVLCFEMEAAGLMSSFPCLVIRGICDYSDTHKNKEWQGYAAAAAAAYAKELLINVPSTQR